MLDVFASPFYGGGRRRGEGALVSYVGSSHFSAPADERKPADRRGGRQPYAVLTGSVIPSCEFSAARGK